MLIVVTPYYSYAITGGDATVKAGALSLYGTRGAFDLSLAHKYRSSRLQLPAVLCFASL